MICPKCGGDTFIMISDVGLKCENCGYVYSIEGKKWINFLCFWIPFYPPIQNQNKNFINDF